jgi:signal peptidase I
MNRPATPDSATTWERLGCELAAEVLRSSGTLRLQTMGASMLPAVWPGDILTVCSHDASQALPGDIVLFSREGKLVAHRVVERTGSSNGIRWVTRGDRVADNDAPVSTHELLGRVTTIERGSRRFTPSPHRSLASRLISWILRSSDFCTRLTLFVGRPRLGTRK